MPAAYGQFFCRAGLERFCAPQGFPYGDAAERISARPCGGVEISPRAGTDRTRKQSYRTTAVRPYVVELRYERTCAAGLVLIMSLDTDLVLSYYRVAVCQFDSEEY